MAVAFDFTNSNDTGVGTATALTWSHTCTGANLMLILGISWSGSGTASAKYNTVAMTSALAQQNCPTANYHSQQFYMFNPPTGANTAEADITVAGAIFSGSHSFTGVAQNAPEATNSGNGTSLLISTAVTTVANNAWVVDNAAMSNAISTLTVGGSQVPDWNRSNATAGKTGAGSHLGPITPPASTSMTWTVSGATGREWAQSLVSLAPFGAVTATPRMTLLGVG